MDRWVEIGGNLFTATVLAVGTFIGWLIRRVFTVQAEIDLLKRDLEKRDVQRGEDREALADVRESVKRIEGWIMEKSK